MTDVAPPAVPPTILFVDHTARMGGGEVALLRLVTAIDPARYRPAVLLFADGPLREQLAEAGVPVTVLPVSTAVGDVRKESLGVRGLLDPRRAWAAGLFVSRVRRFIRDSRVAVVHTNSLKSDLLAGIAARAAGVPLVWHVRDRIADDYLPAAAAAVFRRALSAVPRFVIANSAATMATLGSVAAAGPDRARVVHDSTPVDGLPPATNTGSPPVVGLVGRITPWKGQHVFLDAAAVVRRRFPDVRFQIIGSALFGEDEYDRQIRHRAAQPDLAGAVEFLGFRADVAHCIAALDVVAHASITGEPFGQVVIEAMAAAKPVVATAGGGVPEIVTDHDTGLLVPMADAPALAAALERLLADAQLRADLGRRGRARVEAAFTPAHTARAVEAVYDAVLAQRPMRQNATKCDTKKGAGRRR